VDWIFSCFGKSLDKILAIFVQTKKFPKKKLDMCNFFKMDKYCETGGVIIIIINRIKIIIIIIKIRIEIKD